MKKLIIHLTGDKVATLEYPANITHQDALTIFQKCASVTAGRIEVENSRAYWSVNANYPNNYTLQKDFFHIGKSWLHDKSGIHIYGWVEEETFGEQKGKIKAGHPTVWDEETDSDAVELGYFDTVQEAMAAVINANHPDYGIHC